MVPHIEVSADTMSGVMLCHVKEMFTHPFTQRTFSVSDVLFKTHLTCDDIIGVVFAASNQAFNGATCIQFNAIL